MQECLDKLQKDRNINVAILNATAFAWVRQNPQFKISIPILGDDYMIAPAVKKGDKALLKWINQEMDTLQKDGFLYRFMRLPCSHFMEKNSVLKICFIIKNNKERLAIVIASG
ncbi:amino-acid ABC transporter, periplasmic glutamine-binding protein [Helicobacter fennelliae]|uniref:Amino-acid ABC transporter, periplasmic glutamine-binding protein n=1 Tax=Helicobacter fennelliae TaxID=215 RepID=A0A2X3DGD1_9HELI|nr:transporter substrate-binding domain-containing protein [Helicobacter fennelliae]SQB97300.1 amino-acid ABC transporter, periplasmic glutamine-binding protein [Helicobacter fennelliae]